MTLLSRLRLRSKLLLLLGMFTVALAAAIGAGAVVMQQRMTLDRIDKLRAVVQSAIGVATTLNAEVAAQRITREQALERLAPIIHDMRFDNGEGYIIVRRDAVILLHGADPRLEGKPSATRDAAGRPLADLIANALIGADEGVVSYLFPRPGQSQPQAKLSYVARFAPWEVVFFAGAYVDDLDAALHATLLRLAIAGGAILLTILLAAWLVNRDIAGSLGRLMRGMEQLAAGDLAIEVPGMSRRDEVGAMAGAVRVFQEHMVKEKDLAAAQEHERQRAAAEKQAALNDMADRIESETTTALREVGTRTAAMTATAEEMAASAARTGNSAQAAAAASEQALANAQTVASAAEELSASIREIGSQVAQSSAVVARAVAAGTEARETIETLNEEVGRISAVADMIGEIAGRTNLLALNATIEAARAGEAGKGFAVVASEVKALATQTARSTKEIAEHIAQVRSATGASVAAVDQIGRTIGEVDAIAGSIAAAVEEQGAATAEIARNVAETASAANVMTSRTVEVSAEAERTGRHAAEVHANATGLHDAMGGLRHAVIHVVRTSTTEVDRRGTPRHRVDLSCRLVVPGQEAATASVVDLSERGAALRGGPTLPPGAHAALHIDGLDLPLPCTVHGSEGGALRLEFALDEVAASRVGAFVARQAQRAAA